MLHRLAFVCLLLATHAAFGQTRYISDDIPITLRTGPSIENRIIRNLSAGVRVDALEADEESGWTHVRVASDGTEGWVLTRYLVDEPIARDRLAAAQRELASARSRIGELEAQVDALSSELAQVQAELAAMTSAHESAAAELADIRTASAGVIAIRDENDAMRRKLAEADRRIDRLAMENRELASDSRQSWFMVGAGVLFGGILIGLIAPSLRRKRRSSW